MPSPPGYRYSEEEISFILRRPRRNVIAKSRKREGSLLGSLYTLLVDNQIGLSIAPILTLAVSHALFPGARPHTRRFCELSYYDDSTQTYAPGWNDLPIVLCWLVIFTGLRSGVMGFVLKPLAVRGGLRKKKAIQRFCEQGWLVIYYVLSFGIGLWLWANSKYWFNFRELWTGFPNPAMNATMKWYYLVQMAFWLQQIIVVNTESHRKDYWQMLTHHIITCTLLFTSYSFYMTRVGNVILCLMDFADIILSSAKVLRYLAYQTACDVAFGIFIPAWFITRHILFPLVIWSVWSDLPVVMPLGCYSLATGDKLPQKGATHIAHYMQSDGIVCFDRLVHMHFLGLLIALELIIMVWFGMILRVAWRVIKGLGAADSRSDDEGDEEEEKVLGAVGPVEVEDKRS